MNSKPLDDEATAVALREAGLGVTEGISDAEVTRMYTLQTNATMRKVMLANERRLKGFYVDYLFDKLNLVKYR